MTTGTTLDSLDDLLNIFSLSVEFTKSISECHVRLGQVIDWLISVLVLEEDQTEGELTLGCLNVLGTEFYFVEIQNHTEMLLSLLVVVPINWAVSVVFNWIAKILLNDELAPDLDYLLIEILSLLHLTLLLEDLTHVEVAAA